MKQFLDSSMFFLFIIVAPSKEKVAYTCSNWHKPIPCKKKFAHMCFKTLLTNWNRLTKCETAAQKILIGIISRCTLLPHTVSVSGFPSPIRVDQPWCTARIVLVGDGWKFASRVFDSADGAAGGGYMYGRTDAGGCISILGSSLRHLA